MSELKVGDKALMEVEIVSTSFDNSWYKVKYPCDYEDEKDTKHFARAIRKKGKIHPFINENQIKERIYHECRNLLLKVYDYDSNTLVKLFGTGSVHNILRYFTIEDIAEKIASKTELNVGDIIMKNGYNIAKEFIITKKNKRYNVLCYCKRRRNNATFSCGQRDANCMC